MKISADAVRECLRQKVYDPELGVNVVDLGLLYDIDVRDDNEIYVEMTLTTPGCPLYDTISSEVEAALKERFGEDVEVDINFVWDPPWTPAMMSEEAREELGF